MKNRFNPFDPLVLLAYTALAVAAFPLDLLRFIVVIAAVCLIYVLCSIKNFEQGMDAGEACLVSVLQGEQPSDTQAFIDYLYAKRSGGDKQPTGAD